MGDFYFLFWPLACWCNYFTESCLQSTGKMTSFRFCKMKCEQAHISSSGRFHKHFPPQKPGFALPLAPKHLKTSKGCFCKRNKPLSSSWTNDLRHILMSPKMLALPAPSPMTLSVVHQHFQLPYISLNISQHPRCRRIFSPSGSCLRMFSWVQHIEQVVQRASSVKVLICFWFSKNV